MPSHPATSTVMPATRRINPWMIEVSIVIGQGMAISMNKSGGAKYLTQLQPPK